MTLKNPSAVKIDTDFDLQAQNVTFVLEVISFCDTHFTEFFVAEALNSFSLRITDGDALLTTVDREDVTEV